MKTLEQIKEEYAKSLEYNNWEDFCLCYFGVRVGKCLDDLLKIYAQEVSKEALKNASENAELAFNFHYEEVIDKQSISNENNIPEL